MLECYNGIVEEEDERINIPETKGRLKVERP